MRILSMILNLGLLVFTGLLVLGGDFSVEGPDVILFVLIIVTPLVNLLALFLRGPASKDWLARYMARKAQEERQKYGS